MSERDFWKAVRGALILFVEAIDRRYGFGRYAPSKLVPIKETEAASATTT